MNDDNTVTTDIATEEYTYAYSSMGGEQQVAIPLVLRNIAEKFREKENIILSKGYLNAKIGKNDGRNQIDIEFYNNDEEGIKLISELKNDIDNVTTSNEASSEEIEIKKRLIRLARGSDQDNIPRLLEAIADFVASVEGIHIHDLLIYNYNDDINLIDRPYANIYYSL